MNRRWERAYPVIIGLSLFWSPAWAWETVAPGIEYQSFTLPDPNNVFVTRMDRANTDCIVDSCIGQGKLFSGRETVSGMAARHEDSIGYWGQAWGQRNDVVVAINGDFFDLTTGVPTGGQIQSGWYAKRFGDFAGGSGIAWQLDRDLFIGECVRHIASKQKAAYPATGQDQNITDINTSRGADQLIVYTSQYNITTATDNSGSEVLVQMDRPTLVLPPPSYARGTVVEIRQNLGSTIIPFDHIVLSATGTAATKLLANVSVGSEVRISQEITHYQHDCSTPLPLDWTKTYASIGGSFHFLKNSVIQPSTDPGATARHPRTAVAYNATYLYFIVVDGRSVVSVGMSMTELGNFCLNYLAATDGINQDGGGSSAMWVNGQIKNVPSDGTERAVANGLMMIRVQPKTQSTRFAAGDPVRTRIGVSARVGPGSNYPLFAYISAGTSGVIVDHVIKGVLAKGQYWWRCRFGTTTGWLQESVLVDLVPGDLDWDGDVDGQDFGVFLAAFGRAVGQPQFNAACDFDSDGAVTLADYQVWLGYYRSFVSNPQAPAPIGAPGDADFDDDVDLADFSGLQECLPAPPERLFPCTVAFDFNGDGQVTVPDFVEFAGAFAGP